MHGVALTYTGLLSVTLGIEAGICFEPVGRNVLGFRLSKLSFDRKVGLTFQRKMRKGCWRELGRNRRFLDVKTKDSTFHKEWKS